MNPDKSDGASYYDKLYRDSGEPWDYSRRGCEVLRHDSISSVLAGIKPGFECALDIGCSLGQLTKKLARVSRYVYAFDASETAVKQARNSCGAGNIFFLTAGLPNCPFRRESFDLVIAADAIHEFVHDSRKDSAVQEIGRMLKKDGVVLFTDYLRPERFQSFLDLVRRNEFEIVKIVPLYDRFWYQFESWFKSIRHWGWVRKMLSSVSIAKFLRIPSRIYGRSGSMHILIIAKKT